MSYLHLMKERRKTSKYKDFPRECIGNSDAATLTISGFRRGVGIVAEVIRFGGDGSYFARVINDPGVTIPKRYTKVTAFDTWIKIFDDDAKTFTYHGAGDYINIYRCGDYAAIIQIMKPAWRLFDAVCDVKTRSAWREGVKLYAVELLGNYIDAGGTKMPAEEDLLNGAASWRQYSHGGCSLVCNADIAERLCTPSELKKTDHGLKQPNKQEQWLDVQARALQQASWLIAQEARRMV